jgi:hypothetical protein
MATDLRYKFIMVWYDAQAALERKYILTFYPVDSTLEMVITVLSSN